MANIHLVLLDFFVCNPIQAFNPCFCTLALLDTKDVCHELLLCFEELDIMWVNMEKGEVIFNTRKHDEYFPEEAYLLPVNCEGQMTCERLQVVRDEWLSNIQKCKVVAVFETSDQEPVEVEYDVGCDEDGNPMIRPHYPAEPDDTAFNGWRVHVTFDDAWFGKHVFES